MIELPPSGRGRVGAEPGGFVRGDPSGRPAGRAFGSGVGELLITEAWLPAGLAEAVTAEKLARSALYELLGNAGVILERVQHEISAEIAGPRSAQLLDIAIGAAVLRVNRLAFAGGDRPHHYLSILLSPSRSRILLNHSAEELLIGDTMAMLHDVRPST